MKFFKKTILIWAFLLIALFQNCTSSFKVSNTLSQSSESCLPDDDLPILKTTQTLSQITECDALTLNNRPSSKCLRALESAFFGGPNGKYCLDKSTTAYYSTWAQWGTTPFLPSSLPIKNIKNIVYAFASVDTNGDLQWLEDVENVDTIFLDIWALKNRFPHLKSSLSIGGGGLSTNFPLVLESSTSKNKFISDVKAAITKYHLDAIDIDWEFPSNEIEKNQLTELIQSLSAELSPLGVKLTLAIPSSQSYLAFIDLQTIDPMIDSYLVMTYNLYHPDFREIGPHNGLMDTNNKTNEAIVSDSNIIDGIANVLLKIKGMDLPISAINRDVRYLEVLNADLNTLKKINIGFGFYGLGWQLTDSSLVPEENKFYTLAAPAPSATPTTTYRAIGTVNTSGVEKSGISLFSDIYDFNNGGLKSNYTLTTTLQDSHSCTSMAVLGNTLGDVSVYSFESPEQTQQKAYLLNQLKIGGIMVWSPEGDTENFEYLHAIKQGLQNKQSYLNCDFIYNSSL